jgi:hypothetical protein
MADEQGSSGGRDRRIELTVGGVRLSIPVDALPASPESPPMWYSDWLVWSDVERQMLIALLTLGPRKRSALAAAVERSEDAVKDLIANLTAKKILVNGPEGYAVNIPAERRAELLAWLRSQGP